MKFLRCSFLALIVWLPFTISTSFAFDAAKTYSGKQAKRDLKHLRKLLSKLHPNLYAHRSPKELKRRFDAIVASVKPRNSDGDVAILVQKMLAAVCDEHTSMDMRNRYKAFSSYEKSLFGSHLIATKRYLYLEDQALKEERISLSKIAGKRHPVIRDFLRDIVSSDGCIDEGAVFTRFQPFYTRLMLSQFLGKGYRYSVEPPNDNPFYGRSISFLARDTKNFVHYSRSLPLTKLTISPSVHTFQQNRQSNHPGIFEIHSPDWRYAYINVPHFRGEKKQADAIDKVMREIIKKSPEHVILDLSENPGGGTNQASRLLSYFLKSSHQIAKNVYRSSRSFRADKTFTAISKERMSVHRKSVRQFRKVKRRKGRYTLRMRKAFFRTSQLQRKADRVGESSHSLGGHYGRTRSKTEAKGRYCRLPKWR